MFPIIAIGAVALAGLFLESCTGDRGPSGERGSSGPQGPQGPQGYRGNNGDRGLQGAQGSSGPQGIRGNDGFQGPQGPQGPRGSGIDWSRCIPRSVGFNTNPRNSPLAIARLDCGSGNMVVNGGCRIIVPPLTNPRGRAVDTQILNGPCMGTILSLLLPTNPCSGLSELESGIRVWLCAGGYIIDSSITSYPTVSVAASGLCCPRP